MKRPSQTATRRNSNRHFANISARKLGLLLGLAGIGPIASVSATSHGLFSHQSAGNIAPTAYHVIAPTSYSVVLPSVSHAYVLMPTVQYLPATWLTTTSYSLSPCQGETAVRHSLEPTKVPELQEIPREPEKRSSEPAEKPADPALRNEPKLDNPGPAPPADTEPKKEIRSQPATTKTTEKPADPSPPLAPEARPAEPSKPEKPRTEEVPLNLPPAKPALKPADTLKPADAPLPPPVELPKSLGEKTEPLALPPAVEPPKVETSVPALKPSDNLAPVPTSAKTSGPADKPPIEEPRKISDLPPPVENLPKAPEQPAKGNLPQIPLPEIPPPADDLTPLPPPAAAILPVPELPEKNAGKPVDPATIKSGTTETKPSGETKRDAFKPVIVNTAAILPKLNLSVRDKQSGQSESSVAVIFREPGSSTIKLKTVTDKSGNSIVEIPEGRWEVLVETKSGPLYVLGELVSKGGKVSTVKGRDLPTLEISR